MKQRKRRKFLVRGMVAVGAIALTALFPDPSFGAMECLTMQVSLTRTGGFAGIPQVTTVDTATLSPDAVAELRRLIADAHFFDLPPVLPSGSPQPDRFQYSLTVSEGSQQHTVTVSESAIPENLRPLIDWVQQSRQSR